MNWSGLPKADARKALASVAESFTSAKAGPESYWFRDGAISEKPQAPGVYLLPAFDEYIIGYKDRSACLPARNKSTVISINGIFWPVIVINGVVTGLWKRTVDKQRVTVELEFFARTFLNKNKPLQPALEKAIEDVKTFFIGG
jgi:hypothetical protein